MTISIASLHSAWRSGIDIINHRELKKVNIGLFQ